MKTTQEKRIRFYFRVSLFIKGLFSIVEMLSGVLLFIVPSAVFTSHIITASQNELIEEPGEFFATHALQLAQHVSLASGVIIAIYLITRGAIKLGLVIALWKGRLWAYPLAIAILGLFIAYQIFQIIAGHSVLFAGITAFDIVVVYFIWLEYQIVRKYPGGKRK